MMCVWLHCRYDSSQAIAELIGSAKQAINKSNDPSMIQNLGAAVNNVNSSLDKLLNALSSATPAQKQFNDAADEILRASQKLADLQVSPEEDLGTSIEQIKNASAKLGEATKGIISSSRGNVDQMGGHAKQAASAVATIIDASLALASSQQVSSYAEEAARVKDTAQDLLTSCAITDPAQMKQQVIKSARELTVATQALAETVKRDSLRASDSSIQQQLSFASQTIAAATGALVTAAKGIVGGQPGAKDQLDKGYHTLISIVDDLLNKDPNKTVSGKAKKLLGIARDTASSTSIMIENSKIVHKKPSDSEALAELSQSARTVGTAIKGLMDAAKAIGEIDLDEAIAKISQAVSELDQAMISSTVGLLENTAPPGKTSQLLEEELVDTSRNLAGAIKQLVSEKESPVALAKAARNTADHIPQIAKIAQQIAGLTSDVDKQQETLSIAKSIADAALLLTNACKQNDIKDLVVQAKEASQAIAKMLATLKGNVISLRECDEAAKIVAEAMAPVNAYDLRTPVDPTSSYSDQQRELTSLAKELVGAIATTANVAKSRPTEVGENAKKVAGIIQKFAANAVDALSTVDSVESRAELLKSFQTVGASADKFIKCVKMVGQDSKKAQYQQALSATNKEITESISKLVFAIKQAATGEVRCEEALDSVNRRIAELESAALYAATGQLHAEVEDVDLDQVQNEMTESANKLETVSVNLCVIRFVGLEEFNWCC